MVGARCTDPLASSGQDIGPEGFGCGKRGVGQLHGGADMRSVPRHGDRPAGPRGGGGPGQPGGTTPGQTGQSGNSTARSRLTPARRVMVPMATQTGEGDPPPQRPADAELEFAADQYVPTGTWGSAGRLASMINQTTGKVDRLFTYQDLPLSLKELEARNVRLYNAGIKEGGTLISVIIRAWGAPDWHVEVHFNFDIDLRTTEEDPSEPRPDGKNPTPDGGTSTNPTGGGTSGPDVSGTKESTTSPMSSSTNGVRDMDTTGGYPYTGEGEDAEYDEAEEERPDDEDVDPGEPDDDEEAQDYDDTTDEDPTDDLDDDEEGGGNSIFWENEANLLVMKYVEVDDMSGASASADALYVTAASSYYRFFVL